MNANMKSYEMHNNLIICHLKFSVKIIFVMLNILFFG